MAANVGDSAKEVVNLPTFPLVDATIIRLDGKWNRRVTRPSRDLFFSSFFCRRGDEVSHWVLFAAILWHFQNVAVHFFIGQLSHSGIETLLFYCCWSGVLIISIQQAQLTMSSQQVVTRSFIGGMLTAVVSSFRESREGRSKNIKMSQLFSDY